MSEQPAALRAWHAVVESGDPALLDDLLADDVVFRSPAVFKPQPGKALTTSYLTSAMAARPDQRGGSFPRSAWGRIAA